MEITTMRRREKVKVRMKGGNNYTAKETAAVPLKIKV